MLFKGKTKEKETNQIKLFEEKLPIIRDMETVRGKDFNIALTYIGMPIDFCYMSVFVKNNGLEGVRNFIEKLDEFIKSSDDVKTLVELNVKDNNLMGMMDKHEQQTSDIKTKMLMNISEASEFGNVKKLIKDRTKELNNMHDLHMELLDSIASCQQKCHRKVYEIFSDFVGD